MSPIATLSFTKNAFMASLCALLGASLVTSVLTAKGHVY